MVTTPLMGMRPAGLGVVVVTGVIVKVMAPAWKRRVTRAAARWYACLSPCAAECLQGELRVGGGILQAGVTILWGWLVLTCVLPSGHGERPYCDVCVEPAREARDPAVAGLPHRRWTGRRRPSS